MRKTTRSLRRLNIGQRDALHSSKYVTVSLPDLSRKWENVGKYIVSHDDESKRKLFYFFKEKYFWNMKKYKNYVLAFQMFLKRK